MNGHQDKIIRYKWDSRTESGYRLRYDARRARHTGLRCFRVEEWAQHCKVDEWGFDSLGEALDILQGFFDMDVGSEIQRLEDRLPQTLALA
jgi:hypothetical protein